MNTQDKTYRWHLRSKPVEESENKINAGKQINPLLSKICQYYLECISFDDNQGLSVFADSEFNLDYVELNTFPQNNQNSSSLSTNPDVRKLINQMKQARTRKSLFLGYPSMIYEFKAKKTGEVYKMVEPLMFFPIEMDSLGRNS